MKNLDSINPEFLRPSRFSWVGASGLFLLALTSIPLACGPVPDIPIKENPIALALLGVLIFSVILFILPLVFRWDWKAKYFGCTALSIASFSFLALVPCAVLVVYGTAPLIFNTVVIIIYGVTHYLWCKKFFVVYEYIYAHEELRNMLYKEEVDAVYYLQRGDVYLLEKFFKVSQAPRGRDFLLFSVLAFCLIPVMGYAREFTGIPFTHIFLIVGVLPLSWMCIGLAVRGYLIFYQYPAKIRKSTGKEVYVDLASSCDSLNKSTAAELKRELKNIQ